MSDKKIILASASPRRVDLLKAAGLKFEVKPSSVDEGPILGTSVAETARMRALAKARDVAQQFPETIVIAADTVVEGPGDTLLGKPENKEEAYQMFALLAGTTHRVISVAVVIEEGEEHLFQESAWVSLFELEDEEIRSYIETGESLGKAGGLCVQGEGAKYVENIEGEEKTVMGLPMGPLMSYFLDMDELEKL